MNIAEYLIKRLEQLGINEIFGLPGDYNFNILYAVENNPNTKWIGCTNELNAGYAADGYARMRGYGAVVTTYGVGELSVMNAVAGAMSENVPICHIVGLPNTKNIKNKACLHHNFQDVNYYACYNAYKNITEAVTFLDKDNARDEIDRVLRTLVKEKKPVYIAIPMDIANMHIEENYESYEWYSETKILDTVVAKIIEKFNKSKKPVILGDVLIKRFDAKVEYKEFVEKTRIPVTNFFMGTNIISMDYEQYLGPYCGKFENKLAEIEVNNSDCLIAVGPVYSDLNSYGFSLPYKLNSNVAIYGTYTYVDGIKYENVKMTDVLEKLTEIISERNVKVNKQKLGYEIKNPTTKSLSFDYIFPRLQGFFKENDILIAETGLIPYGFANMKLPYNLDMQTQTLWGAIGWATPATLGCGLAKPKARVVLVTGEGAHQLTAMELGNMLRLGVKPIIIVINNNGYSTERIISNKEDELFNDIVQMNYAKFARSFGGDIWSTKVETEDDFDKALKVTQIMNKLCYIEVCVDKNDSPNITKKIISDFKNKVSNMEIVPIAHSDVVVKRENNFSFETIVHKGLKEE